MEIGKLMRIIEYGDQPAALYIDMANGKRYRKKYESLNVLIADVRKHHVFDKATIDDVLIQQSLLDKKKFLLIYGHEE